MLCLGLEPRTSGWKVQTNPLSYSVLWKILPTYGIRTKENQMKATSEALRLTARLISNCRIVVRVNVGLRSFVAVPVPIIRCRLRLQFHKKKFSSFFRAVARVKMSLINFLNVISL